MIEQFKLLIIVSFLFSIAEFVKTRKLSLISYQDCFYLIAQIILIVPCIYYFKLFLITSSSFIGIHPSSIMEKQSLLSQVFLMLFFGDLVSYICHRLFHTRYLWLFHEVHHTTRKMNWAKAQVSHPIDSILTFGTIYFFVHMFSFSLESLAVVQLISLIYGFLSHSKIHFRFGFFDYVFISPTSHHLHHSLLKKNESSHKNFSSFFSIWDILFGTFQKPDSKPLTYGTNSRELKTLKQQLLSPLTKFLRKN